MTSPHTKKYICTAALAITLMSATTRADRKGNQMNEETNSHPISKTVLLRSDGKTVTPIFSDRFKVVGIGLKAGQKLEKHTTQTTAFLFVHEGKIRFDIQGKSFELKVGDYYQFRRRSSTS
jgi:quercetin dioxygenase-like cupin family protein